MTIIDFEQLIATDSFKASVCIIGTGPAGGIVPPRNAIALTFALKQLLQDFTLCRAMGNRGRIIAKVTYTLSHVLNASACIYEKLLSR